MKEAAVAALITLAVLVTAAQALIGQAAGTECEIDPVPYEKLLAETLEKIIAQDWEGAQKLIEIAKQAQICSPRIASEHEDLYDALAQLSDLLQRADIIEEKFGAGETEGLKDQVREVYNDLDYLRQAVYSYATTYYQSLGRYAQDKTSFFEYKLRINRDLDTLKGVVGDSMERLARIYAMLNEEGSGAWIDISVSLPRRIYAGDEVGVSVLLRLNSTGEAPANVSEARVRVSLVIGYVLEVSKEVIAEVGTNTTVHLEVPGTDEILRKGADLIRIIGSVYAVFSKVAVTAESLDGSVEGFTVRSTYVYAVRPPIQFYVPSYAEANGTLAIRAVSNAASPINVSIYLDEVSNETLLANTTVQPGTSWANLSLTNVSVGYHTIIFLSEPASRYVPSRWSSAVVVGSPTIPLVMNVPRVVLVPPFVISVGGELGAGVGDCDVVIYVDGAEVYHSSVSGKYFSALLDLPLSLSTLLVGRSVIKVEVVPHAPGLSPTEYVVDVVVINVLSTLVIIGVTGSLYLHPRTSAIFASLLRTALLKGRGTDTRRHVVIGRGRAFRPFRLRKYYAALIRLLSRLVGSPAPHETLREYLGRVEGALAPRVAGLVRRLFSLFEADLYSRRAPDAREARNLLRAVEEELGEGVREG